MLKLLLILIKLTITSLRSTWESPLSTLKSLWQSLLSSLAVTLAPVAQARPEQRYLRGTVTTPSSTLSLGSLAMVTSRLVVAADGSAMPKPIWSLLALLVEEGAQIVCSRGLLASHEVAESVCQASSLQASSACALPSLTTSTRLLHEVAAVVPCSASRWHSVPGAGGCVTSALLDYHLQKWWG